MSKFLKSKASRRQFLVGAGGFTLSLPLLPSLLPRGAEAQVGSGPRRFVAMRTEHGGIKEDRAYPSDATLTNVVDLFSDHQIRWGNLAPTVANGTTSISPMLSAPSSALTPALVSKLNVMRGMDVTGYIAHNSAAQLGNYGPGGAGCSGCPAHPYIPTIDQVLAWSDSFYPSLAGIRERSLVLANRGFSWGYSNPATQSGNVVELEADGRALPLFDRLFQGVSSDPEPRRLVVDRVLEGYQRMSNGTFGAGRRLSSADKTRLDDHMQQLFELERRLTTRTANCDVSTPPGNPPAPAYKSTDTTEQRLYYQAFNDVYRTFFTQEYPARAFIGVSTLLFDARFEVQGIAIKR